MQAFPNRIQRIIDEGYSFKFGDYISRGFDIMNKHPGEFIVFIVIWGILSSIINFIGEAIPSILGLSIIELISTLIITPCLTLGFYLACKDAEFNNPFGIGRLFDGFKYWQELIVITLIQTAIFLIPSLLLGGMLYSVVDIFDWYEVAANSTPFIIGLVVYVIIVLYISIIWQFGPLLMVFEKMKPWTALEASRKIVSQHWFTFLGFAIVVMIIILLGAVALLLGLLYTIPAGIAMLYASYSDIVGFSEEDEEMDLIDHLID